MSPSAQSAWSPESSGSAERLQLEARQLRVKSREASEVVLVISAS